MSARPGRRSRRPGVVVLAGWLFADLLLVLALVSMADRPDPLAAARPEPTTSASDSASPSPTPSPTGPEGVSRSPVKFTVHGTDKGGLERQLRSATARWKGRTAALVLTFGGGNGGTVYAHRVNSVLTEARPDMFGRRMATDDFLDLGARADTAMVRVYFYTRPAG